MPVFAAVAAIGMNGVILSGCGSAVPADDPQTGLVEAVSDPDAGDTDSGNHSVEAVSADSVSEADQKTEIVFADSSNIGADAAGQDSVTGSGSGSDAEIGDHGEDASAGLNYGTSESMQQLENTIRVNYIDGRTAYGESWAVTCVNLTEESMFSINGEQSLLSASVLKLFIMGAAYAEGRTDLYNEMYSMITVSDNDAANRIVESLGGGSFADGMAVVNAFCQENGYTGTSMGRRFLGDNSQGDNYTTADDCAKFLSDIYNGICVSAAASQEMVSLLQQQTKTNKIPTGIAGYGAVTANKTGELADGSLGYVENDTAIVWGANSDYVLCILSNQINNSSAVTAIQQISTEVYQEIG